MSTTKEGVKSFLKRLKAKIALYDILYEDDRPKNTQTLATLELKPYERDEIVKNLSVNDYSEGPKPEDFFGGDSEMYVFGKTVKKQEIYIKVTLGQPNNSVICISFHISEYPMDYPFK
jgi:hypothetical protein